MILTLYFLENAFCKVENKDANLVRFFFHHFNNANLFKKGLLTISLNYKENGIIPYSAHFYK